MIFLKIKLNNIYMFKDATLDLTYARKLSNPTVPYEFLEDFPKINFKRVCILTGANASGKTVLGKSLCMISNYLVGRDVNAKGGTLNITDKIWDKKKPGSFTVEFVTPEDGLFHHISVSIDQHGLVQEDYRNLVMRPSHNYNDLVRRVFESPSYHSFYNREKQNHGVKSPGFRSFAASIGQLLSVENQVWNYCFTGYHDTPLKPTNTDVKLFETILKSFDSSIKSVKRITGSEKDSFLVKFSNKDEALISDGEVQDSNRFSRGTLESLELASFYQWLKRGERGTYFLDEKMAYSHSLVEQTILNLFIEILGKQAQLFVTTHNLDILGMNLPMHSFTFLRKDVYSEIIHPEKLGFINKNDRNLVGFVRNDVFNTLPSIEMLNELL